MQLTPQAGEKFCLLHAEGAKALPVLMEKPELNFHLPAKQGDVDLRAEVEGFFYKESTSHTQELHLSGLPKGQERLAHAGGIPLHYSLKLVEHGKKDSILDGLITGGNYSSDKGKSYKLFVRYPTTSAVVGMGLQLPGFDSRHFHPQVTYLPQSREMQWEFFVRLPEGKTVPQKAQLEVKIARKPRFQRIPLRWRVAPQWRVE